MADKKSDVEQSDDAKAPAGSNSERPAAAGHEQANRLAIAYERLAEKTQELFEGSAERTAALLDSAVEKARAQLENTGDLSGEEWQHMATYLKRDLEQTGRDFSELGEKSKEFLARDFKQTKADLERLGQRAEQALHPARLGAGFLSLASTVLHKAGHVFEELAERSDKALAYRSGEVTRPGTLVCDACGAEMRFRHAGGIPPCPKCHKTEFHRRY